MLVVCDIRQATRGVGAGDNADSLASPAVVIVPIALIVLLWWFEVGCGC